MATTEWNDDWNDENYEWPVISMADPVVVEKLGKKVIARGGRAVKEGHADRGVMMEFPNKAVPNTKIRKQVPRAECRRQAQVVLTDVPVPPLKVCIVCDAMHLWPAFA